MTIASVSTIMTTTVTRHDVERSGVDVVAHQLAIVGEQEHEDQHEGQHRPVDHLRQHRGCTSDLGTSNAGPDDDEQRVANRTPAPRETSCRGPIEASPSQTTYDVEIGRIDAANSDALNEPATNNRYACCPASGRPAPHRLRPVSARPLA